ncbi:leucine-rich repeat extensin-like protein 5 [Micropterus salmoides]|uniref:leucine-rich repeat extensin-like protein 5 n=1 Tax=Micropterus salmoides TaxID=27706 RepID=UPI0018EA8F09|nr:leucine-rich repeat extensin-like protein 5 [Micropterus salmoides]
MHKLTPRSPPRDPAKKKTTHQRPTIPSQPSGPGSSPLPGSDNAGKPGPTVPQPSRGASPPRVQAEPAAPELRKPEAGPGPGQGHSLPSQPPPRKRSKTHPNNTVHVPKGFMNAPTVREAAGRSSGSPTPAEEGPGEERRSWSPRPRDTPPAPEMSKSQRLGLDCEVLYGGLKTRSVVTKVHANQHHPATHIARSPPDRNPPQASSPAFPSAMPAPSNPPGTTHRTHTQGPTGSQPSTESHHICTEREPKPEQVYVSTLLCYKSQSFFFFFGLTWESQIAM